MVTVTLPETTLKSLEVIDTDRARAIVLATELALSREKSDVAVDLLSVAPDTAVLAMPYSPALSEIDGLTLIRMLPGRYLVLLDHSMTLAEVEVAVLDWLELAEAPPAEEQAVFAALLEQLRKLRRAGRAKTSQLILVSS